MKGSTGMMLRNGALARRYTQRQIAHPVQLHLMIVDQLPSIFNARKTRERPMEELVQSVEAAAVIGR